VSHKKQSLFLGSNPVFQQADQDIDDPSGGMAIP